MKKMRVLLIEDDPMVCEINRQFIDRLDKFEIVATAKNGSEGLEAITQFKPDLVFMEMNLPSMDGFETLQAIRTNYLEVDVIPITAANDYTTVQKCLRLGVVDYIIKPYTFDRIEKALTHYLEWRVKLQHFNSFKQDQLDAILYPFVESEVNSKEKNEVAPLPKGFNQATLLKVLNYLKKTNGGASAEEVAKNIGVARVTARRYLDYMEKQQLIQVEIQYGNVGRPINQYFVQD